MKVGTKISKQMNTWAFLSDWSQNDFHNEPLVSVFEFSEISSWLRLCPSRNRHSSVEILHWFISLHEPPFRVFSSCFSFLGMPFFISFFSFCSFFYCFTARLKLELCSKWMNFFFYYFPKEEILQLEYLHLIQMDF